MLPPAVSQGRISSLGMQPSEIDTHLLTVIAIAIAEMIARSRERFLTRSLRRSMLLLIGVLRLVMAEIHMEAEGKTQKRNDSARFSNSCADCSM